VNGPAGRVTFGVAIRGRHCPQVARRRIDGDALLQNPASTDRTVSPTRRISLGSVSRPRDRQRRSAYENSYAWIMKLADGQVIDGTAFYDSISFNDLWARVQPV
jgi:ketosteroid isomerase-like protein